MIALARSIAPLGVLSSIVSAPSADAAVPRTSYVARFVCDVSVTRIIGPGCTPAPRRPVRTTTKANYREVITIPRWSSAREVTVRRAGNPEYTTSIATASTDANGLLHVQFTSYGGSRTIVQDAAAPGRATISGHQIIFDAGSESETGRCTADVRTAPPPILPSEASK